MDYKKIITNFNKYKKINRVKNKLTNLFYKKHSLNLITDISAFFIVLFSILAPYVFISILNIENKIIDVILFLPLMSAIIVAIFKKINSYNNQKLSKIEKINSYLKLFFVEKVLFFIKDEEISKMNDIFNKHITNEELELTNEFRDIESNVMSNYKNEFINKNKEKFKYKYSAFSLSNLELDAYFYAKNKNLGFVDMIIYTIQNIKINELKSITEKEMDSLLDNFNTEDKIKITDSIKNRLIDINKKEEELSNNLNEINNIKNEQVSILKNNKITIS